MECVKRYLSPKEASQYVGVTEATLQKWRTIGINLEFCKLGDAHSSRIVYDIHDLDKYIASKKVKIFRGLR
ncbi:MAG: helix-turn-helix domain-containing protein [Sulfurospirillum sp.]|jgi:hypothetical protein|nr:DNA-binding protein [Erysipelotrichia bacterium]